MDRPEKYITWNHQLIAELRSAFVDTMQDTKLLMNRWIQFSMTHTRGEANALEALSASDPDYTEGVRAIIERRDPEFPSARDE